MGNIFRLLTSSRSQDLPPDVFVDFENCEPSADERAIWEETHAILAESADIIALLRNYKGAAVEIRDAINFPQDTEKQEAVWRAIVPLVENQLQAYNYSKSINDLIPKLLATLCIDSEDANETLEQKQALFKQFAEILDFCLNFDDLKVSGKRDPVTASKFFLFMSKRVLTSCSALIGHDNLSRYHLCLHSKKNYGFIFLNSCL